MRLLFTIILKELYNVLQSMILPYNWLNTVSTSYSKHRKWSRLYTLIFSIYNTYIKNQFTFGNRIKLHTYQTTSNNTNKTIHLALVNKQQKLPTYPTYFCKACHWNQAYVLFGLMWNTQTLQSTKLIYIYIHTVLHQILISKSWQQVIRFNQHISFT